MAILIYLFAAGLRGWKASSGPATVEVDETNFSYSVSVRGGVWLGNGGVAFQCGGVRYEVPHTAATRPLNLRGVTQSNGSYAAIAAVWSASNCSDLRTEVRRYTDGSVEFIATVLAPANGTATEATLVKDGTRTATEFPSFALPGVPPPPRPGPPAVVGCSDGTCDALCALPDVRGCAATWLGAKDLRAAATGRGCGASEPCEAPADACGPGWTVCLGHAGGLGPDALAFAKAVTAEECAGAGTGAFLAAMSHAPAAATSCPAVPNRTADNGCAHSGYGSEPLCCGAPCGVPSCSNALWDGATRALFGRSSGRGSCAAVTIGARVPQGVLCCRDRPKGAGNHAPPVPFGLLTWRGNSLRRPPAQQPLQRPPPHPARQVAWSRTCRRRPTFLSGSAASRAAPSCSTSPTWRQWCSVRPTASRAPSSPAWVTGSWRACKGSSPHCRPTTRRALRFSAEMMA